MYMKSACVCGSRKRKRVKTSNDRSSREALAYVSGRLDKTRKADNRPDPDRFGKRSPSRYFLVLLSPDSKLFSTRIRTRLTPTPVHAISPYKIFYVR